MYKGDKPIVVVCSSVEYLTEEVNLLGRYDVLERLKLLHRILRRDVNPAKLYDNKYGFSFGRMLFTLDYMLFNPDYFKYTDGIVYLNKYMVPILLSGLLDGEYGTVLFRSYRFAHNFAKLAVSGEFEITWDEFEECRMARKIFKQTKMQGSNIFRAAKGKENILQALMQKEKTDEMRRLHTLQMGR